MREPIARGSRAIPSIPEGTATFFRLNPADLGKVRCFAVKRGEIEIRLDPYYNIPRHRALIKQLETRQFSAFSLHDERLVRRIIEGRITPKEESYTEDEDAPVFLRAQNIEEGYLNFSDSKRLKVEAFYEEPKAILEDGDVVLTIDGALLGIAAVHRKGDALCCISNHMVRLIAGEFLIPDYLAWFLNSPTGQKQIKRGITGSAIPGIRADAIERIIVPIPPLAIQREMVAEMEKEREAQRRKISQGDFLLSSLDSLLLERLGLITQQRKYQRFFAARLGDLKSRCDPDFHSPKFRALRESIERCGHQVLSVDEVCLSIKSGFAAGREVQAFNDVQGIPHIRPLNISPHGELSFEGTKYVPKDSITQGEIIQIGEVLLNNTNSTEWVGKSTVFEEKRICCCSNHITRLNVNQNIALPMYIACLFNALRSTGYFGLLATNFVNQAGINAETLAALRIPIPDLKTQREIVKELGDRRIKAKRLHNEAAHGWEVAKAQFETRLLADEVVT